MKLHPFYECVRDADMLIHKGVKVYQQFNCAKCGMKQTIGEADTFYKTGQCEECGYITNIEDDGCNYMAVFGGRMP